MNSIFRTACAILIGSKILIGGNDPKAKSILDELSKNSKAYSCIEAEVVHTGMKDKKKTESNVLKLKLKGKKYRLEIPGNLIVSNGQKVWSKNNESGEVTIKDPDEGSELNPTNIFSIYEKGYSSTLIKTIKSGKTTTYVIRLIPDDKKKTDSIYVYVDGSKKKMNKMEVFKKKGVSESFEVKKFTPSTAAKENEFYIDTAKMPKDLVIDETEGK